MAVIYKYFVPPGLFLVRSRCLISDFRPLTSDPCSLSPAFNGAFPIRARHIDRQHFQSVPLRILDNRERLIKTHRKSTRLNSSHTVISYAVFCLKKKKSIVDSALGHERAPWHAHLSSQ